MARIRDLLPWRLRRRLEQFQLGALRYLPGLNEIKVQDGSHSASLIAVGDIALYGSVGEAIACSGTKSLEKGMQSLLENCDLRIGNLETMLTSQVKKTGSIGGFQNAPLKAVDFLTAAKFDVVSVANNHARDCHLSGMIECCQLLEKHGIRTCGGGASVEQARTPAIVDVNGLKIGVLGYCDNFRVDADNAENVSPATLFDDWVESDIRDLRRQSDLVVLQLHWGWEFSLYPPLSYRNRARRFADAGADLVLCHHAHVPMGIEVWNNSIIAHGLGNFVFPQGEYLLGGHPWTYRSFVLKVFFNNSGVLRAEITPYVINEDGFPSIATGCVAAEILGGIGKSSARLCDDKLLAWVERDRTVRETVAYFEALGKSDPSKAQEWALQLHSPFQKGIISSLGQQFGIAGEQLASFMLQLAESAADPQLAFSLRIRSREKDVVSALENLRSSYPIPEDLPGRVP